MPTNPALAGAEGNQSTQDRNINGATPDATANQNKGLTETQSKQYRLELEEARDIMTKRRAKKRMPLVEDFNLDEIFPEDVRDQLMKPKRQRT
jgi:hypothetical protein